ncbi:hypothetical protein CSW58_07010 [Caulobacter sp. B11]|uniref:DUF6950 family protein n=1 Tax=Caulobacter sp. B11 TaxID=2048899 RepID=UPI000C12D14B|nr:hypothetical protein [Caulobacter sp. B11]PHY13252.1 hypothetical protein CSW58_07010 [Caulobacter sp. B11]
MAQLGAYLEIAGRKPMAWGVNDCMLFAADWLWSVAGQDPAAAWRGRYRTEAGAARIVRKLGGMVPLMMAGRPP